jgi:hypothetical protein
MVAEHVVIVWRDENPPGFEDTLVVHAECRAADTTHWVFGASFMGEALVRSITAVEDPAVASLLVADHESRCDLGTATKVIQAARKAVLK